MDGWHLVSSSFRGNADRPLRGSPDDGPRSHQGTENRRTRRRPARQGRLRTLRSPVRRLASDRFARRHRKEGKAAFIAEAEASGHAPSVDQIRVTNEVASADIAARLNLKPRERVIVRSRRYLADGRPVETATSYIPESIAKGTPITEVNTGPGGIYGRIEDAGHELARFTEEVSARMPTPDERKALEIGAGIPVMTLVRTAYDTNGVPVEVCDTVKIAHSFVLEYDVPAQ